MSALPDSTWKFKERKQTLVQKGKNNIPKINDFSLTDEDGNNVTESVLNEPGNYYLVFLKEVPDNTDSWIRGVERIADERKRQVNMFIWLQPRLLK